MRLNRFVIFFSVSLFISTGFYGCKTMDTLGVQHGEDTAAVIKDVPGDALHVIAQSAALITGKPAADGVTFDEHAMSVLKLSEIAGSLFGMKSFSLYLYDHSAGPSWRSIVAEIDFEDGLGRKVSCKLIADYLLLKSGIRVSRAQITPIYRSDIETVCFILPLKKLPSSAEQIPKSFYKLYKLSGMSAVTPGNTENNGGNNEWAAVVFFMDKISPTAKVKLCVSSDSGGTTGYDKSAVYIDYSGWRVGMLTGRFLLMDTDARDKLYLKAVYIPGQESGMLKINQLVGLYRLF